MFSVKLFGKNDAIHTAGRVYSHFGANICTHLPIHMACRVVSGTDVPVHMADDDQFVPAYYTAYPPQLLNT